MNSGQSSQICCLFTFCHISCKPDLDKKNACTVHRRKASIISTALFRLFSLRFLPSKMPMKGRISRDELESFFSGGGEVVAVELMAV
jgi:hypothetical protein